MTLADVIAPLVGAFAVLGAALIAYSSTKGKTRADVRNAMDERIDKRLETAWARLDSLEEQSRARAKEYDDLTHRMRERDSAFARIFRAIAKQWPHSRGPDIDPLDLSIVEDTIPATWIRREKKKEE